MRRPFILIALISILAVSASDFLAASDMRAAASDPASDAEFSDSWILVRLKEPLAGRTAEDAYPLGTPFSELNALIQANAIPKIENALPASTRSPRAPEALSRHGLDRIYRFHVPLGSDIPELVQRFSELPQVEWAEPDFIRRPAVLPNDPLFPYQWGLHQASDADVDAPEGWEMATGDGLTVAVIDTGVDWDHPDLAGKWVEPWDFVDGDDVPEDYPGGTFSGHGTNTASIIGAYTDNLVGIAGVCWGCALMPLRIFDQHGNYGYDSMIADALVWATDREARVINLSLGAGYTGGSQTLLSGVAYAYDAGAIQVAVTANDGIGSVVYPGAYTENLAIGATDDQDERASFSNWGPEIDVVAPGENIISADLDGAYLPWNGTSYSAPLVSGLIGIMRSLNPSLGREEARHLVRAGAEDGIGDPSDTPGFDVYYGWGRVNAERTLTATESSISLRVEGKAATRVSFSGANTLAGSYDFIRGDLSALSESATGVNLGDVVCLENDSPDADTAGGNEDLGTPPPGAVFFYLARFNADNGAGSYGGSSRNRDRVEFPWQWSVESDQQGSLLGVSVASAGDVNGDGYGDVVVGAHQYDNGEANEGVARVYLGSPTGLATAPAWSGEGNQAGAIFGAFVGGAGDVNGDGYDDVIVGAANYDNGETNEGRAYVYLGSSSGLDATPDWTAEAEQAGAKLGMRVGTAGDVNGDGWDDVIVSARFYDNPEIDEGRAYVFHGSATGLSPGWDWDFDTDQFQAQMSAVGTAGDVNGDGWDDVIVGSRFYDGGETDEGRAWVFLGSAAGLSPSAATTLEIDVAGAEFGFAVAAAGDIDGDGYDDVVVGAPYHDDQGAAFVYMGSPSGIVNTPTPWTFEANQRDAGVGRSVGGLGDINADGYDDVIVGADEYNSTRTDEGRVWVLLGSASGLTGSASWSGVGWQVTGGFGWSAATAGDVNGDGNDDVIVGAYLHDNGESNEGRAYVYHGPGLSTDCPHGKP